MAASSLVPSFESASSSESIEYTTLARFRDRLTTAFKASHVTIANELVAKGVVPQDVLDKALRVGVDDGKKATEILQSVLDQVKVCPRKYHDFMALPSFNNLCYCSLYEEIMAVYETLKSEVVRPKSATKAEDESDDITFHCPCGECSLDKYLDEGCPKSTSEDFPYLDVCNLDEDVREDLIQKLLEDNTNIIKHFADLINGTRESLVKRDIAVETLTAHALSLGAYYDAKAMPKPLLDADVEKLQEANTVRRVFIILQPHMSFFNYELLKHITDCKELCTDDDRKRMDEYCIKLNEFCRRKTFEVPPGAFGQSTAVAKKSNRKVFAVLITEQEGEHNLAFVNKAKHKVASILKLKSSSLYLHRIDQGSIILVFSIPEFVANEIFPLDSSTKAKLKSKGLQVKVPITTKDPKTDKMSVSPQNSPVNSSDGEQETHPPVSNRPERMRDWLIRMINSGRFTGLEWLDEDHTVFKVPWTHSKKRGYNKEGNTTLFCEWAMHSGKYRQDIDPTVWKINFRCAINGLKDIMEIKDMQTEDCRVYKVIPSRIRTRGRRQKVARQRAEPYPTSFATSTDVATNCYTPPYTQLKMEYPPYVPGGPESSYVDPMSLHSSCTSAAGVGMLSGIVPAAVFTLSSTGKSLQDTCVSYYGSLVHKAPSTLPHHHQSISSIHPAVQGATDLTLVQQDSPDSGFGKSVHSAISTGSLYASSSSSVVTPICASPTAKLTTDDNQLVDIMPALPPKNQLQISIFYDSITVHTEHLDCDKGCRIFSSKESLPSSASWQEDEKTIQFFGPPDAKNIALPNDHPQSCAQDIFNAMRRGVLIEASDGNVYVTPLCGTVVYCGSSLSEPAQPLEKEVRTKVFDYRHHFRPALNQYALVHSHRPTPYFILGLGQNWGRGRHVTQNLISIVITHMQAKQEIDAIDLTHAVTPDLKAEPYSINCATSTDDHTDIHEQTEAD